MGAIRLAYLVELSPLVKPELKNSPFIRREDLSVKSKVPGTKSKITPHLVFGRTEKLNPSDHSLILTKQAPFLDPSRYE